jgi:hypothetical protein
MSTQEVVQQKNKSYNRSILIPVIVALFTANFLFFIDEGYYDFRWMLKSWNWLIFFIYSAFLFSGQLLIRYTLFRKANGYSILCSFLGVVVGTGIAFLVFSGVWR